MDFTHNLAQSSQVQELVPALGHTQHSPRLLERDGVELTEAGVDLVVLVAHEAAPDPPELSIEEGPQVRKPGLGVT